MRRYHILPLICLSLLTASCSGGMGSGEYAAILEGLEKDFGGSGWESTVSHSGC